MIDKLMIEKLIENRAVVPVSPSAVLQLQRDSIPKQVFEAYNELIIKNFDGNQSIVTKAELESQISNKLGCASLVVENKGYLNVKHFYVSAGWNVTVLSGLNVEEESLVFKKEKPTLVF
jgi:hypothetical protein